MSEGGYIRLWRKARKNGWMRNPLLWTFWTWLLTGAAYKPHTTRIGFTRVELQPGQLAFTVKQACFEIRATPQQIRTCIDTLKTEENITVKSTNKFSVITIINWAAYQSDEDTSNKQPNKQTTNKQQTNNKPLIVEKGKEGKEGKEERLAASPSPPISILGIQKTKTPKLIPDDLALTPQMIDHATGLGIENVQRVFESFKAHHANKGTRGLSWGQGWITWCGNETKFKGGNGGAPRKTFEEMAREKSDRDERIFLERQREKEKRP